jgi:hypothetical protein
VIKETLVDEPFEDLDGVLDRVSFVHACAFEKLPKKWNISTSGGGIFFTVRVKDVRLLSLHHLDGRCCQW